MEVDTTPECRNEEVEVNIYLKEKSRYSLTYDAMRSTEGNGLSHGLNVKVRNVFGHGEVLNMSTTFNPSEQSNINSNRFNVTNDYNVDVSLSKLRPFAWRASPSSNNTYNIKKNEAASGSTNIETKENSSYFMDKLKDATFDIQVCLLLRDPHYPRWSFTLYC